MRLQEFKKELQLHLEADIRGTKMLKKSLEDHQAEHDLDHSVEISYEDSRINAFTHILKLLDKMESEVK